MASYNKLVFLFAVCCVSVLLLMQPTNAQAISCEAGEVPAQCTTACNTRCKNVPIACEPPCHPGCECKPGLLRNLQGTCVAEAEC